MAGTILLNAFFSCLEVFMANLCCLRDSCMSKDRVEGVFRKNTCFGLFLPSVEKDVPVYVPCPFQPPRACESNV